MQRRCCRRPIFSTRERLAADGTRAHFRLRQVHAIIAPQQQPPAQRDVMNKEGAETAAISSSPVTATPHPLHCDEVPGGGLQQAPPLGTIPMTAGLSTRAMSAAVDDHLLRQLEGVLDAMQACRYRERAGQV